MAAKGTSDGPIRSVRDALKRCRMLLGFAVLFGTAVNMLMLTGPLYMLQVYDRVLPSESVPTLIALTVILAVAYLALTAIDEARANVVSKIGLRVERLLSARLVRDSWRDPARSARALPILKDLDAYRRFIGGQPIIAIMDLPFTPFFVLVIFMIHPYMGWFSVGTVALLLALAVVTQIVTSRRLKEAAQSSDENNRKLIDISRATEAVRAMGMSDVLITRWSGERDEMTGDETVARHRAATMRSITRGVRLAVQSLLLGLGAWLVLQREITPGGMIAGTIILSRALAPLEQLVGMWAQYGAARLAVKNLNEALAGMAGETAAERTPLPPLEGRVAFDNVIYMPTQGAPAILKQISFEIPPGEFVGVLGPSGAGKSTIARMAVGALAPTRGRVLLDGAEPWMYEPAELGPQIGYLPQDGQMLRGSIAENIARFAEGGAADAVAAAKLVGVHDVILALPNGYETEIGDGRPTLSTGQAQRVGLARALFRTPKLIVLDEPNANLDTEGEQALARAIGAARAQGSSGMIVTHRRGILAQVQRLMIVNDGQIQAYGPRDHILARLRDQSKAAGVRMIRSQDDARAAAGPAGQDGGGDDDGDVRTTSRVDEAS